MGRGDHAQHGGGVYVSSHAEAQRRGGKGKPVTLNLFDLWSLRSRVHHAAESAHDLGWILKRVQHDDAETGAY